MLPTSDPSLEWSLEQVMLGAFRSDHLTWRSSWIRGTPLALGGCRKIARQSSFRVSF